MDPEEALVGEQVDSLWSFPQPRILEIITFTVPVQDIPKDPVLSLVDLNTPKYPSLAFL